MEYEKNPLRPTGAFIAASWGSLGIGILSYIVGLWNAEILLSEKGFYFSVLLLGFYSTISLSKSVRDKSEGIPVTGIFYGLSWASFGASCMLLVVGLWNAEMLLNEKGFYGLAFMLSIFGAMAVQKNVRDCKGALNLPSFGKKQTSEEKISDHVSISK
jgi:uncharacterized membrane protein YiaA